MFNIMFNIIYLDDIIIQALLPVNFTKYVVLFFYCAVNTKCNNINWYCASFGYYKNGVPSFHMVSSGGMKKACIIH